MKEIREIFETVRTYCGMIFGENRAAKSVMGNTESILAPMAGERICGRTECNESGKRADGAKCDKFRRAAFTLAEVLITLGIIGVVAALTLPTLIQNHQKQVYVTQLKKAYSNISNAYNQIANDEGVTEWSQTCFTDWTGNNNCLHKLAKQMKAINTKDFGVTCSADWCSAALSANTSSTFYETDGMLVTSDGMVYIFACGTLLSTIIVDVNGVKGPNKAGRDVFEFKQKATSGYDANGHWVVSYYNSLEPIGTDSDEWKNCSATNLSTDCTAKVLIEGNMNY